MFIEWKKMFCLITYIDFFINLTLYGASFSGKHELSNLDYYYQDDEKQVHK